MITKVKRIIAVLCALCILAGFAPVGIYAAESGNGTFADKNGTEFTWSYDADTKVLTIGGTGAMTWSLDNHISGLPWASFKEEITDVKFESGVTALGRQLLSGLTGLTELTIPGTVATLEWGVLDHCTSLKSVVLEPGVKTIGDKVFQYCSSLESVTIPETVVHMGNAVFLNTAVKEVTIPASVTSIVPKNVYHTQFTFDGVADGFVAKIYRGSHAASWVTNPELNVASRFTYEFIGEDAEKVTGTMANKAGTADAITWTYDPNTLSLSVEGTGGIIDFTEGSSSNNPWLSYRTKIAYVVIGEGINHIGGRNFESHSILTNVVFPSTLRSMGAYAFNSTSNLTKIVLPRGFTHLNASGVFNRSGGIKEIVLPPTITAINASALRYLPADTKLVVTGGSAVHDWVMSEANNCQLTDGTSAPKLYEVVKDGGNVGSKITWEYDWENKALVFTGDGDMPDANDRPWFVWRSLAEKAIINHGITNVGKVCFADFTALKEVELPTSIKIFRDNCFKGCTALTELEIPYGTNTLGLTFITGSGIKSLFVPESVNQIYPNSVNQLHRHKSFGSIAEDFELIVARNSYAHTWATDTTTDKDSGETINNYESILTVKEPGGKVNDTIDWAYDIDTNTMTFTGTGAMPDWTTIDIDGDGAVADEPAYFTLRPWNAYVASTVKLVIGEGITEFGADSFRSGSSLKEVVFPSTLKRIEQYAFANTSLTEVSFNSGLEYIGAGAFQQSNAAEILQKAVIPNSVIAINTTSFRNQTALTIYCYADSYAQSWADTNSVKHILMDSDYYVTYSISDTKAVVTNYTEEAVDSVVIIANYTNGNLNDIYYEEKSLAPGKNEITATDLSQEMGTVTKVLVWSSWSAVKPLCDSVSAKITPTIRIAGDSISAKWPLERYGQQGWGEPFKNEWTDDVAVINDAVSGWTTEKYYNEKWAGIKAEMNPGDYLIVSYLHNDYYVPIKDTTQTDYINTYRGYLEKLIKETKEIGVNIVLVVPPNRGVQGNFHGDFSFVMPALAAEYNVPCIDVHAKTIEMLDSDLEGTKQLLYMYKLVEQGIITADQLASHSNETFRKNGEDLTHLSTQGAAWVADYVAAQMADIIPELSAFEK